MAANKVLAGVVAAAVTALTLADLLGAQTGYGFSLGGLAAVLLLCFWVWHSPALNRAGVPTAAARSDALIDQVEAYLTAVNEQRAFPPPRLDRVMEQPGEPALAACNAQVGEVVRVGGTGYAGTRVMVGGVPIYLGGSAPVRRDEIQLSDVGELALTSARLIFVSSAVTTEVALSSINGVEYGRDYIKLAVRNGKRPTLFMVPNGLLWGILIRNMIKWKPQGRQFPEGSSLAVDA